MNLTSVRGVKVEGFLEHKEASNKRSITTNDVYHILYTSWILVTRIQRII